MAKKEKEKKVFFEADLELVRINENNLRYRVKNPTGIPNDITHIQMPRKSFPIDADFSLHFMEADIRGPNFKPTDPNEIIDDDGMAMLEKKQAEFRMFKNLTITITE